MKRLGRRFYERGALELAPDLLGKVLVAGECSGRIVEVEAYRSDDPASHAFGGRTRRNATMFGPAGHLYVYFSYGMHHCANVVAATEGDAQAVLLRGVEPVAGIDVMRSRRGAVRDRDLANGPGKLCQAFGLDRHDDGIDLVRGVVGIYADATAPPDYVTTPRIGISKGVDLPWRYVVG